MNQIGSRGRRLSPQYERTDRWTVASSYFVCLGRNKRAVIKMSSDRCEGRKKNHSDKVLSEQPGRTFTCFSHYMKLCPRLTGTSDIVTYKHLIYMCHDDRRQVSVAYNGVCVLFVVARCVFWQLHLNALSRVCG